MDKKYLNVEVSNVLKALNIPEYDKKSIVLTNGLDEEGILELLKNLREAMTLEKENDFISTISLPWVEFVPKYYSKYAGFDRYKNDKTFAYKLYIASKKATKLVDNEIKGKSVSYQTLNNADYDYIALLDNSNTTLSDVYNYVSKMHNLEKKATDNMLVRMIYIFKDVDAKTAEDLHFTRYYSNDKYNGFDLDGKLSLYNEIPRRILEDRIGLGDGKIHTNKEIADNLGVSGSMVKQIADYNLDRLVDSKETIKTRLMIKDYGDKTDDNIVYGNKTMKDLDYKINYAYYYNRLDEETKKLVDSFESQTMKMLYVASLYMYKSNKKLGYMSNMHESVIDDMKEKGFLPSLLKKTNTKVK